MLAIRSPLLSFLAALAVLVSASAIAKESAKPASRPLKLNFSGTEYLHRQSQGGRSDFTPASQPDLKTWRDRMTVIVRDQVTSSDQLSTIAGNLVATVDDLGEVVHAESKSNPATGETEHFIAARVDAPDYSQAAFARIALVDGKGMVIVYSHRAYGAHSAEAIGGWIDRNGESIESALMSWKDLPTPAQLRALPQAK